MKIKIIFDLRDMWIGLYWNHRKEYNFEYQCDYIEFYICLIPCFPIYIYYNIDKTFKKLEYK